MELDYWLFKNKCSKIKLAKAIGVHPQTVFSVISKKRTPSLFTALSIEKYTSGEVKLFELLNDEDKKTFVKVYNF